MTITIGIASTLSMSIPRHDRDHVTEKGATLKLDPHAPDHWRSTINADVHRRVVPGTQTSQGKGRRGGSDTVTGSARVYRIVPSSVTTRKKSFIILL